MKKRLYHVKNNGREKWMYMLGEIKKYRGILYSFFHKFSLQYKCCRK